MKINNISQLINPASRLTDMQALLHSYTYRLAICGKVFIDTPLRNIARAPGSVRWTRSFDFTVENPGDLTSVLYEQRTSHEDDIEDDAARTHFVRWPFWVESPLQLQFGFDTDCGLFLQEFLFEPEKSYTIESVTGFLA